MSNIPSIQNIIDATNKVKEALNTLDRSAFNEQSFGYETEYTGKRIYAELDILLTDITALTNAPEQFLNVSTHAERNNIFQQLNNSLQIIGLPGRFFATLEELKQAMRPFNSRYTKERSAVFDKELLEQTEKKQKLTAQINELESQLKTLSKTKEEYEKTLTNLQTEQGELQTDITTIKSSSAEINQIIQSIKNQGQNITNIENQAQHHKVIIDDFVTNITARTVEIETQSAETNSYKDKLVDFTKQHKESLQEVKSIIKKAKEALHLNSASGIGQFFQERLAKLEPENDEILEKLTTDRSFLWLIFALAFSGVAIYLSYEFIKAIQTEGIELTLNIILARLLTLMFPLAGAWFCAGQYTKIKNIAEDYAYKTVLVQSIIGFSEHLKNPDDENDTNYKDYMKRMLDEIHQHPLKVHKADSGNRRHEKLLDQLLEKLENLAKNKKDIQ